MQVNDNNCSFLWAELNLHPPLLHFALRTMTSLSQYYFYSSSPPPGSVLVFPTSTSMGPEKASRSKSALAFTSALFLPPRPLLADRSRLREAQEVMKMDSMHSTSSRLNCDTHFKSN